MITNVFFLFLLIKFAASDVTNFTYNGFQSANLSLDGVAYITHNGLLRLNNDTSQAKGHAFYPLPFQFEHPSNGNGTLSFSTSFVFEITHQDPFLSGHGIAFVVSRLKELPGALPSQYLGLFNASNNGNSSNHVFAVELDTIQSSEFGDIDDNHVGIDINSLRSINSTTACYYVNERGIWVKRNLSLISKGPKQVWIEYDGGRKQLNVTLTPIYLQKPNRPLLSVFVDLSPVMLEDMYVGFSSSTGSVLNSHYILGWSFKINGQARELDLLHLPKLPRLGPKPKPKILTVGLPLFAVTLTLIAVSIIGIVIRRKIQFAEVIEDWEHEYGPRRFSFKDLFIATNGFKDNKLLGIGGFGRVYKGVLPKTNIEIAVKRISHESKQGMREFIAEIASLGRLRHRNLVQLLGYCRRKGELLLIYDYMPNGSLDKILFDQKASLDWNRRFHIIKGVASGIFYLHEGWEQIVIHRDIKASNVLLDNELSGRLGDFGLARLYDHGTDPQTTHVVGTLGYMAPELTKIRKATTSTDVFAFGAFILEVATGRKPIDPRELEEEPILVDWVLQCCRRGIILEASDPKLGTNYVVDEMELVLKLGLLCSRPMPGDRPTMKQVVQFLDGQVPLPELSWDGLNSGILRGGHGEGFDDLIVSCPSDYAFTHSSSAMESLLSGGR